MLNRIFFFLAFSLPLGAFAQTQFSILDIPVCWNDSSIIKYTYVTASGAYLDLGYYSPGGQPVTVSGGTLKTGFCVPSDSLSIDSIGRTFTLNIGDQSVSWNAGAEYYAQLLDVDTVGVDTNYIAKYSPSASGWKMYDNNLDGLTDAIKDTITGNVFAGFINISDTTLQSGAILNTSFGNGLRRLRNGFGNTTVGFAVLPHLRSGYDNISMGVETNNLDTSGIESITIGNYINTITYSPDSLGKGRLVRDVIIGHGADPLNKISTDEIVIGAYSVGKGDSTVTLGLPFYKGTYLNGNLNLNGYGAGNKLPGLIAKTGSPYLALLATDGTIAEIHRDSVGGGSTTLGGLTDVTLTSPQPGEVLIYNGTDWVNDTVVNTLTAINGLRNAGTLINPEIRLGDTLIEDTEVTQLGFDMIFDQSAASTGIFRAGSVDSFGVYAEINQNKNGRITLFSGYSGDVQVTGNIALATKNVQDSVAAPGMFLKLIDVQNGRVEWDTVPTGGGGGGFTLPTDSITFNDNTGAAVAGKLQRDDNTGTLVYGSPTGTELRLQPPGWYVKNQTGSTIPRGTVVRASGTLGNSDQILIDKMIADGSIEGKFLLGVTAEDIADGADGWVFSQGKIKPVDLSAYNSGEVLYVSTTVAGAFTDTLPTAPDLVLPLGFVVDSTSNGTLAVRVTFNPTVTATNGLTATPGADNTQVKLGGDLTETTKIDGTHTYGLWLDSLSFLNAYARGDIRLRADSTTFGTNSALTFDDFTGASLTNFGSANKYTSTLFFGRTAALELKQTREFGGVNYENGFRVNSADASAEIYSQNKDSLTLITSIKLDPEKLIIRTPNINDALSSAGSVLSLIDSTTGEVDYLPLNTLESDTAQVIDFENLPQKIYQWDFTGKSAATASFSNVKTGAIYVIHVLNSTSGDVITWPANTKTETGATLTSTTLSGTGRIFTLYSDGTNTYIK